MIRRLLRPSSPRTAAWLTPLGAAALAAAAFGSASASPASPAATATPAAPPAATAAGVVALKAGSAHLVEDGAVLEGGVTLLVRDGKIAAIGTDVAVPAGAKVVDYGPEATLIPGLVSANSRLGTNGLPPRTASPGTRAIDAFDPYGGAFIDDLAEGITSTYLPPARSRLIGGQGALVKVAGDEPGQRVLSDSACLQGSISKDARNTPGFWEPPVPATVDVGMGYAKPQLPRTTMGAIVALEELLAAAASGDLDTEYGPHAPGELRAMLDANTPWRMRAETVPEIRALLAFARDKGLPLILDGVHEGADIAQEIANAGVGAIVEVDFYPDRMPLPDLGKGPDAVWPRYDAAAALRKAGVPIAICGMGAYYSSLRFDAALASRGGLSAEEALRAITLGPAELLGVADRIGSLTVGKDADVAVMNGSPLSATSAVLATWVDGELGWEAPSGSATVIEVSELHVGDGSVLRPGQALIQDGRLVEVGARVSHPAGAKVVRGFAAMPGMIDALGHLGLEGSTKAPAADYKLSRIVEPGDETDRRVALAGVTTVFLGPRGKNKSGTPLMAYHPAAADFDDLVVRETVAVGYSWEDRNRIESGKDVREVLEKAVEYDREWREYEEAMKTWTPPKEPVEPPKLEADDEADEDEDDEDAKEDEEDEKSDKDSKKKKRKKKGDDEDEPVEVPGIWLGEVTVPPMEDAVRLRLRLESDADSGMANAVLGYLRCGALSDELIDVHGSIDGKALSLSGRGTKGRVTLDGEIRGDELTGTVKLGGTEIELKVERETKELKYARRPETVGGESDASEEEDDDKSKKKVKGAPKKPKTDDKLELMRAAMRGELAVMVEVSREDEILDCVSAFEEAGIRPVLVGAEDAWKVAGEIRGRVSGVLLSPRVQRFEARGGFNSRANRFAELASAGIPVAFHSGAEEGAAQLPLVAAWAISRGLSPSRALQALTSAPAEMVRVHDEIGRLSAGLVADVLLLDGPPLEPATRVLRAWVGGEEVR